MHHDPKQPRRVPSHFLPRTLWGKAAVLFFAVVYILSQWPVLPWVNRIEPRILGIPFLFVYLLAIYLLFIIGLLFFTRRRS